MKTLLNRREFMIQGLRAAASACLAASTLSGGLYASRRTGTGDCDVAVVSGDDPTACAVKAVELLGGIEKFVPPKSRVALLANPQSSHPGTFTSPRVVRAAIRLCRRAGASEINLLSWQAAKNLESTGLAQTAAEEGAGLKIVGREEDNFRPLPVPKGKVLREARLLNVFFEHDVFINMPVTKDHAGNQFTGTMKNLMGLNSPASNRTFHRENWKTDPEAIDFLDQCIADLATAVRPTFCLVDATEFIVTNGPFGPGDLLKARKVVAGTDMVAVDAYCASLWGLKADHLFQIKHGYEHGLGEMRLANVNVKEVNL